MRANLRGPARQRPVLPAAVWRHETGGRRDQFGRFTVGVNESHKHHMVTGIGDRHRFVGQPEAPDLWADSGVRCRRDEIDRLLGDLDFPALYRGYTWNDDTWEKEFPGIYRLEQEMISASRGCTLGPAHVQKIARRDSVPDHNAANCTGRLSILLYIDNMPAYWLRHKPESSVRIIEDQIPGLGPACTSRILRFAVPVVFGAIDTDLVRVFGHGDPGAQRYHLVDLAASPSGTHWTIPAGQAIWPEEYGVWVETLQAIARRLNREEVCCPHPEPFLRSGLRDECIWAAADVEMALASYASVALRKMRAPQGVVHK
ncbi:MAG: hypothetical protein WBJ20_03515 [Candidatus Methanoculleus thermohydrogenotrophicum]|nr:hypothetical protein [Candidatus Methanoculleus thermohydrogenotrophicum]